MSSHEETTGGKPDMHPNLARGLAVEKALARLPSYGDVSIRTSAETGISTLHASLSSRSDELKATRHWEQSYLVGPKLDVVHTSHLAPLAKDVSISCSSPSGHLTVHFRAVGEGKDEKRVIEVMYANSGVVSELNVGKQHAGFLSGETWGNPSWHPTLNVLVYVAEQHPPSWDAADKPFSAFEYYPNAGEKLYEAHKPALFLLDLRDLHKAKVDQITEIKADSDPAYTQPVFAPTSEGEDLVLFATGRSLLRSGRRLGVIWCYNRPTAIYRLTAALKDTGKAKAQVISEAGRSARSPRVLSEGAKTYLFYLSNRSEYEHNSCGSLHRLDVSAGSSVEATHADILVDTVWAPASLDAFPGLFVAELPDSPFLAVDTDGGERVTYVTMNTTWRSQERLITVRVHDGKLQSHAEAPFEDVNAYNTDGRNRLVAVASQITALPQLRIAEARLAGDAIHFKWQTVKEWKPTLAQSIIDGMPRLHSSVIRLPDDPATEILFLSPLTAPAESDSGNAVASAPQSTIFGDGKEVSTIPPLLFDLHGGPNSANTTGFSRSGFSYAAAGFSVAFVNYPGSTGFGQERIEMLSEDCANLDVLAIRNARDYLVKLGLATTEKGKQHYDGGSHSGFIGAHLSARWPDMFDSVCLRNPVIDLPSCFATSDIPDWSVAQFGVRYDFANPPSFAPTGAEHARLVECSPSSHLVKRLADSKEPCMPPTLLQLGSADLRVPPTQGLAWYHALKAHCEPVTLLLWPGHGHGLQNEADQPKPFEAVLSFIVERAVF